MSTVFTDDTGQYTSAALPAGQKYVCVKIDAVTPYSAVIPYSSSSPSTSADDAYATSALGPYPLSATGPTTFSWKPTSVGDPIDQALDISNAVLTGARWLELYGIKPKFLSLLYPYPTQLATTQIATRTSVADINSDDAFDWGVILHEYGHYVSDLVGIINNTPVSSSAHDFPWNMTDHEADKNQGLAISWNEGFADFFSQMVQRAMDTSSLGLRHVGASPPIYIDETAQGQLSLNLDAPGSTRQNPSRGEDNEASVARVLWDLYQQPMFSGVAGSISFIKVLANSLTSDPRRDLSHAVSALLTALHASPWIPNVGTASTNASIPSGYSEDAAAPTYGKILSDQNVAPTITTDTVGPSNKITLEWKPSQDNAADTLNLFVVQFWDSSWSTLLTENVITYDTDVPSSSGCPQRTVDDSLYNLCLTAPSTWAAGSVHVVVVGWNTKSSPPGLTMPSSVPSVLVSGLDPLTGPYVSAPVTVSIS